MFSQIEKFADDFILPIDFAPVLTGGYGEPRTRHFHKGIDFRTYRNGRPIYAVADGKVSRIIVSPYWYGQALFVEHSNGFTSVYAHLNNFNPQIGAFVRNIQYEKQSFAIDTSCVLGFFYVKQGEIIAYSGNTGHSFGPHLHFELIDTKTRKSFNTLNTVYDIKDDRKPEVYGIVIYPLNHNSVVNNSNVKSYYKLSNVANGIYRTQPPYIYAGGEIGIGVDYVDRMTGTNNRYGIKDAKLFINDNLVYHSNFSKLSPYNQSQKNSVFDYEYYLKERKHVQRLYREPNNTKNIFKTLVGDGTFVPEKDSVYYVKIMLSDFYDNTSTVNFRIIGTNYDIYAEESDNLLCYKTNHLLKLDNLWVKIEAGSFFKNKEFSVNKVSESDFSDVYTVGEPHSVVKQPYKIFFNLNNSAKKFKDRLLIKCVHHNRSFYYIPTINEDYAYSNLRLFGEFSLIVDTVSPKIRPVNIRNNKNMSSYRFIEFEISDDISGIKSYNLFINDKWVLAQYEPKDKSVRYYFDDMVNKGETHKLQFIVKDKLGNKSEYSCNFYY